MFGLTEWQFIKCQTAPGSYDVFSFLSTCRHLLQNSSMTLDTMSDLTRDILELADNDITDKVTKPTDDVC